LEAGGIHAFDLKTDSLFQSPIAKD